MRKVERYMNWIMIDGVVVYQEKMTDKDVRGSNWENNWEEIEPKYYIDKSDDMIFEIWYNRTGIILDRGLNKHLKNGEISEDWGIGRFEEISYKEAMQMLDRKNKLSYNNKDLMSRVEDELEKENEEPRFDITKAIKESKGNICCEIEAPTVKQNKIRETKEQYKEKDYILEDDKQNNNGGATDYYTLPEDANTLQDLIEHRNMNGSVKDIFKACYRLGIKTEDELRDLNKMAYYSLREIGRITSRKDYITIAKELMGSQAVEEYCTCKECNGERMI